MDKMVARELLPLVNDPEDFASLVGYADYRISVLSKELETSVDINIILRLQGQIKELRRMHDLKVSAIQHSRDN
jgi:hypothetical protein